MRRGGTGWIAAPQVRWPWRQVSSQGDGGLIWICWTKDAAMPRSAKPVFAAAAAKARRPAGRGRAAKSYHHGDLRRVLIEAALDLVEQGGVEAVSVREAARRAGVSPGAPFRHFQSRSALIAAVAEEAQRRFRAEIATAIAEAPGGDPLARFRAIGVA